MTTDLLWRGKKREREKGHMVLRRGLGNYLSGEGKGGKIA